MALPPVPSAYGYSQTTRTPESNWMGTSMGGRERRGRAIVIIGGKAYDRMLSLTLKRSKQEGCCSGTVVFSWPGAEQFNLQNQVARDFVSGAKIVIMLDDQLAATAIIDKRISKGSPKHYELTFEFRGQCAVGVDSHPHSQTGQWNQMSAQDVMQQLIQGFPIQIEGGMSNSQPIERFIHAEGDTVEQSARRAVRQRGGTFWETVRGNWCLEQHGEWSCGSQGAALTLGRNILQWSVRTDVAPQFGEVQHLSNGIATEERHGEPNENIMSMVKRSLGPLANDKFFREVLEGDMDKQAGQDFTEMEGDRREGWNQVTIQTSTWTDDNGMLWDVNNKHHVSIPVDGVEGTCTVQEVVFELTADSRRATLTLVDDGVWGAGGESVLYTDGKPVTRQQYEEEQKTQEVVIEPARPGESTEQNRRRREEALRRAFQQVEEEGG